ncbi:ankyrin repeat family protein [Actinidia rufa]|uniref:Ankyrin repeat family protein n=1 Tax=Actinidia rufa TaxID=165716 RepID=A0A7J0D8V8_9ERIC|nr:ankyrin repeat family protein [Actinidia rufa]
MSKSTTVTKKSTAAMRPEDYKHSPVHYAVALSDHTTLSRIVSTLPRLADPSQDPHRVGLAYPGASLRPDLLRTRPPRQSSPGNAAPPRRPPQRCLRSQNSCRRRSRHLLAERHRLEPLAGGYLPAVLRCRGGSSPASAPRRLVEVASSIAAANRCPPPDERDFYMEISFHFESSIVPFVGFDGMKVQRADQSFLFLGDGEPTLDIPSGSLLVLNRDDRKIFDAFENAGTPLSDSDIAGFCAQTSVYRPGMDVTQAELVGRTNWRRQEKTESVGEWKARVYEVHNVVFSYRSRKIVTGDSDLAGSEQVLPLELDEDADGFLVAENPQFSSSDNRRRHSSFIREEKDFFLVSRNSVDVPSMVVPERRRHSPALSAAPPPQTKEKEYVKSLRPSVWLTEQFPLKTEELLPLLDILANKVKAVRRMRELLTTKFPPGTFPVKVAIPVVPTVRVVITFTKFVELQPTEQFYTPFSSPRHFVNERGSDEEPESSSSSASTSWLRRSTSRPSCSSKQWQWQQNYSMGQSSDPFAIPSGYTWSSFDEKNRKMKKTKSTRKAK